MRTKIPLPLAASLCVIVAFGALMFVASLVRAQSYMVTATVPAPSLISPATIGSPTDGAVVRQAAITVSGSCPGSSYVRLVQNGYPTGVAICQPNGSYQIQINLAPGLNQLVAQDYNITNNPGPDSATISVTYTAPPAESSSQASPASQIIVNAPNLPNSNLSNSVGRGPLNISATPSYSYKSTTIGSKVGWRIDITGGLAPYFITVTWGDGTTSNYLLKSASTLAIEHVYQKAGIYNIEVEAVDASGYKIVYQLSVSVRDGRTAGIQGKAASASTAVAGARHWKDLLWPACLIIILMLVSFWLGAKKAYKYPSKRHQSKTGH